MNKKYITLGKRGRTTIPLEYRVKYGYASNNLISFEDKGDGSIVIRKEKVCNHCSDFLTNEFKEASLLELLNGLTLSEQTAAYRYLGRKLTSMENRR